MNKIDADSTQIACLRFLQTFGQILPKPRLKVCQAFCPSTDLPFSKNDKTFIVETQPKFLNMFKWQLRISTRIEWFECEP